MVYGMEILYINYMIYIPVLADQTDESKYLANEGWVNIDTQYNFTAIRCFFSIDKWLTDLCILDHGCLLLQVTNDISPEFSFFLWGCIFSKPVFAFKLSYPHS